MQKITVVILLAFLFIFKSVVVSQDFHGCQPGYISVTVGTGEPGNPIQTFTNVPNICTTSSSISQPGLLPIGQTVRLNPPAYTGSVGSRPGRIISYQWSRFPDRADVELRFIIRFTPDLNMYLDTAALLPSEFEVVNDSLSTFEHSNTDSLYISTMYGVQ